MLNNSKKQKSANNKKKEEKRKSYWQGNGFVRTLQFLVAVIGVIFILSVFLRVSEVRVIGNEHYTQQEIIRAVGIEEGDNIFFFDRFAAISRVFAKLPYVEEVTVERKLPGIVTISVKECKAVAYISVGEEDWTIDPNCKVLGKAAEGENTGLIPVVGFKPGTLLIGERLSTKNGDTDPVEYLSEILDQIDGRKIAGNVQRIDMSNLKKVKILYGTNYTLILGAHHNTEHKFGMIMSTVSQLLAGDIGIIDVSDDTTSYFTPT